ncbi:MBL fold metallo-hydrolase [Pusillimonas sp. CC-YST705]|uniref:MBL fold metallo-hydrolase n=1 Tax=Mesopusillimonas faecipullorum TaxID=2755040 RepID=A0ABS8CA93_9BURK|nr:MBL fold metallo-hydrolase [Mesopusillimonas faecipullorum]MCB5362544.1 MBL fold metallo-hydrolase [Mesopusillimonas faecipullorum]
MLEFCSLGGAGTVTGSKHVLTSEGRRLMVDCGLFQGLKNLREQNWESLPLSTSSIDAVVLTHGHLDHCGYLPRLAKDGFKGPVFMTGATREVSELILKDSGFLQEKDAQYANRHGFSKHQPALPLYTVQDVERVLEQFKVAPWHTATALPGGATLTYRSAGHILGAATAQVDWAGRRVVFSGDLGRYGDAMMHDPEPVHGADYVVIESTYGNRLHDHTDPVEVLGSIIERTVRRGGTVVIPAFAVGRVQALLCYLWRLRQAGRLTNVPIYVDSPMASSATKLLCRFNNDHKLSPEQCQAVCDVASYTPDVEASKALSANRYPKVIVSASGMATGGRVLHHLVAFAQDHKNTVLFSGYQAAGTRGRAMLQGEKEIRIFGYWMPVRAEVAELSMLSAHADAGELMRWLGGFKRAPRQVFIVHGEPEASEAMRVRIGRELGWNAVVPRQGQTFTL